MTESEGLAGRGVRWSGWGGAGHDTAVHGRPGLGRWGRVYV